MAMAGANVTADLNNSRILASEEEASPASLRKTSLVLERIILDEIRKTQSSNKRANSDNIPAIIAKRHGLDPQVITVHLNDMIMDGKIKDITFRGKKSFRIKPSLDASLRNDMDLSVPKTNNDLQDSCVSESEEDGYAYGLDIDYEKLLEEQRDFVYKVSAENESLKQRIKTLDTKTSENFSDGVVKKRRNDIDNDFSAHARNYSSLCPSQEPHPPQSQNFIESKLIQCLQERIDSLERQLNQKQHVIELLLCNAEAKINDAIEIPKTKDVKTSLENTSNKSNFIYNSPKGMEKNSNPSKTTSANIQNNQSKNNRTSKKNNQMKGTTQREQAPPSIARIAPNNSVDSAEKNTTNKEGRPSKRLNVVIVGESMLNNIAANGLNRNHNVRVEAHSGASMEDMLDYIKPPARRKPDVVVLHCGTNDFTKGVNTIPALKEVIKEIKEITPDTQIAISSIVERTDKKVKLKDIEDMNRKLKSLCVERKMMFIDNSNLEENCLGMKGLHPNKRGNAYLAKNFLNAFEKF